MNSLRESSVKPFRLVTSGIWISCLLLAGILTGCDDGAKSSSSRASSTEAKIAGNIKDQHGPILNSRLEVTDKNGNLVLKNLLDNTDQFSITVPTGTAYPIVITAHPQGESAANSSAVKAVVTSPLADRIDVTDVSTIVVDSAISLGGLTAENIAKASGAAIGLRQREGVSAGAGGGGGGAGQSGGGVSRGGHGGHGAPAEGGGTSGTTGSGGTGEHGSGHPMSSGTNQ